MFEPLCKCSKTQYLFNETNILVVNWPKWHDKLQHLFCGVLYNQWKIKKHAIPLKLIEQKWQIILSFGEFPLQLDTMNNFSLEFNWLKDLFFFETFAFLYNPWVTTVKPFTAVNNASILRMVLRWFWDDGKRIGRWS